MDGGWLQRGIVSFVVLILIGSRATASAGHTSVPAVAIDTPLGDHPVTAQFANSAAVSPGAYAVLSIENLKGRSTQPIRINVFVDKPDANRSTPVTDPRWAGVIQLLPRQGDVRSMGTVLDLSALVSPGSGKSIAITLVPVVGVDNAPNGVDLTLGRMSIRYERQ